MFSRLLLPALLILAAATVAAAESEPDSTALAQRLHDELALAIDAAQLAGRDIDASRLQRIEAEVDAGIADGSRQRGNAGGIEKLLQLRGLLANASRYNQLRVEGTAASLPHAYLQPALAVRAAAVESLGSSCRTPWDLAVGKALSTQLAATGASGDGFWLRVAASQRETIAVSTLGSRGDVDIAVYAECTDAQPLVVSDDFHGLQALAVLPSTSASLLIGVGNRDRIRPAQDEFTFDFELARSGRIGGGLTVEGAPLPTYASLQMQLRGPNGASSNAVLQRTAGGYTLADIVPGEYRVLVEDSYVAYGQAYPGVDCGGAACLGAPLGQLVTRASAAGARRHLPPGADGQRHLVCQWHGGLSGARSSRLQTRRSRVADRFAKRATAQTAQTSSSETARPIVPHRGSLWSTSPAARSARKR